MPPGGLSAASYGTLFGRPVLTVEYCAALGDEGDIICAAKVKELTGAEVKDEDRRGKQEIMSYALPDARGHFGVYGGMFVAETLMQPLTELREAYERYRADPDFLREVDPNAPLAALEFQ